MVGELAAATNRSRFRPSTRQVDALQPCIVDALQPCVVDALHSCVLEVRCGVPFVTICIQEHRLPGGADWASSPYICNRAGDQMSVTHYSLSHYSLTNPSVTIRSLLLSRSPAGEKRAQDERLQALTTGSLFLM